MKALIAAGLIALGLAGAQTQTPPRDQARLTSVGTATIAGTVVADDETRGPLRHAVVTLTRTGVEDIRTATTDEQGQFLFDALPATTFRLTASKGGYLAMSYGAPQPGGMPGRVITLTDGQRFSTGSIALMRGAVIAGRLTDRNGRPVANTEVTANRFVLVGGERRQRITEGSSRSSITNGHGDYRIYGLMLGEYMVYAVPQYGGTHNETTAAEVTWVARLTGPAAPAGPVPPAGRTFNYAPTIFPGTADASAAAPIALARGEERLAVDFSLLDVPISRVTGVVTGLDGRPAVGATVRTAPKQLGPFTESTIFSARTGADGRFVVDNLPPGEYGIVARSVPVAPQSLDPAARAGLTPVSMLLWGKADVSLSGQDVTDVAIQLQPGVSVAGRIVAVGVTGSPALDLTRVRVSLGSAGRDFSLTNPGTVTVMADGTFRFEGVVPGSFRLTVTAPPAAGALTSSWSVRSVTMSGRDVTDASFEIAPGADLSGLVVTLTDAQTQVTGALIDGAGKAVPELYVLVFSADRALWPAGARRIKSARALENGTYTIDGLPAGEYYLCALTELDLMLIYESSFLEQLVPSAIKITLGEGEKKKQDLRVGR